MKETRADKLALLDEVGFDIPSLDDSDPERKGIPSFFENKRFMHNVMGDYLIDMYSVCKINDTLHIYDNGIYQKGDEILHGQMLELIPTLTDRQRKEVCKYMQASFHTPTKLVSPPHLIPFKSQIYDLHNDCFLEYSPDRVFLNRFPYDYSLDAKPEPLVDQTVAAIADNDGEIMMLLFEAMGNCFYLLNQYRGAVMLYGRSGNNGKSTLLNMIAQLVGDSNTGFLSLQDTAEKFRLVELYGKAVNIGDDIPDSYLPDSSIFKKLVTGEAIMAEKKGQDAFPFKPFAKLFFAMNGLPAVSDKSKAFFGRILLIPLNRDFSGSGNNVSLKDRRWTDSEMEWLTALAMDGLKRLIKQGDFTKPKIVMDALADYEQSQNPIIEFIDEVGGIEGEPVVDVYYEFQEWARSAGHKNILTRRKFTAAISDYTGLKSTPCRHRGHPGKIVRCFIKDY